MTNWKVTASLDGIVIAQETFTDKTEANQTAARYRDEAGRADIEVTVKRERG